MSDEELRALDVEIHRKVMGEEYYEQEGKFWYILPFVTDVTGKPFPLPIPFYSTEINAAWLVVEKLAAENRGTLVLQDWLDVRGTPGRWCALFDLPDGHDTGQILADTAPLAICKAILKSIE